jgi:cytochrome c553
MKKLPSSYTVAALTLMPLLALAQSPPPAELSGCIACHGTKGISQLINAPHLAGQPEIYLTEQLKAYRSGKRPNEVMAVIAKPLTDAQIEIAAKWYSSVKIEVKE